MRLSRGIDLGIVETKGEIIIRNVVRYEQILEENCIRFYLILFHEVFNDSNKARWKNNIYDCDSVYIIITLLFSVQTPGV